MKTVSYTCGHAGDPSEGLTWSNSGLKNFIEAIHAAGCSLDAAFLKFFSKIVLQMSDILNAK